MLHANKLAGSGGDKSGFRHLLVRKKKIALKATKTMDENEKCLTYCQEFGMICNAAYSGLEVGLSPP